MQSLRGPYREAARLLDPPRKSSACERRQPGDCWKPPSLPLYRRPSVSIHGRPFPSYLNDHQARPQVPRPSFRPVPIPSGNGFGPKVKTASPSPTPTSPSPTPTSSSARPPTANSKPPTASSPAANPTLPLGPNTPKPSSPPTTSCLWIEHPLFQSPSRRLDGR